MKNSNRRKFIGGAAGAAAMFAGAPVLANTVIRTDPSLPLVHHVFFWLKNPASVADRDKLVEGVKTLSKIETVHALRVGVVAATEKRPVVDTSWQVSELIFFTDLAGQATYQTHPVHLDFIKNYGHLWEKVIVYDAMDA